MKIKKDKKQLETNNYLSPEPMPVPTDSTHSVKASTLIGGTIGQGGKVFLGNRNYVMDGENSRTLIYDGSHSRVLIGKREDGTYGIDISAEGYNVLGADPSELDFTSIGGTTTVDNADKLDGQHAPAGTIVGTTDIQTLSNKTLTAPDIDVGSDATGDVYYRDSGGEFARLGIGTAGQVLTVASGLPSWAAASGGGGGGIVTNVAFWTQVPGSPAYASGTTIDIADAGNANLYDKLFQKGVIIAWESSGGDFKVAMVTSSSYSSDVVTITVMGSAVESGDTNFYYSNITALKETFIYVGTFPSAAQTDVCKTFWLPSDSYVLGADVRCKTAGTGAGTNVIDINDDGSTMFTTKPDLSTNTSDLNNAADSPASARAKDSAITIDIDSVTATTQPVDGYIDLFYVPQSWIYYAYAPNTVSGFWQDVPGNPAYASGTTIEIEDPGNASLYDKTFQKGLVLQWLKSDDTYKLGVITASSYSADVVTVTVRGSTVESGDKSFQYGQAQCPIERFIIAGTFAAGADVGKTFYLPSDSYVLSADLRVKTAGTGTGSNVVDINDDGSTMFTTKPTVTTGTSDLDNVADTVTTLHAKDSLITLDIDSVTATTACTDGYIDLYYIPTWWRYR